MKKDMIKVYGAKENNLKNINVKFPLNILTVITGVSGSGKSSLINETLVKQSIKIPLSHSSDNSP